MMAVFAGSSLALAWWLLAGDGLRAGSGWLAWIGPPGDEFRRICLGVALSIYYVRLLFTEFVFLTRGVSWKEVLTVSVWLLGIVLLLSVAGGGNQAAFGAAGGAGCVLFLFGSWMNTYAEYSRHIWKRQPGNEKKLYTEGLFRYARHPNYLGDLLLFSGLSLLSGAWITVIIPLLMLAGFVFINVPILDSHLRDHYGAAFERYARDTRRLIPFLW